MQWLTTSYTPPHPQLDGLPKAEWSRLMWDQLFARPFQVTNWNAEREWLDGFTEAIPCWDCKHHFRNHIVFHPPDFSSSQAYFFWAWWAKNMVNRRLNKPLYPWKLKLWGEPAYAVADFFRDNS